MAYNTFKGTVIEGNKMGRKLGYPTANLSTTETLPPRGVYLAKIKLQTQTFYGLLNIGIRPTFELTQLCIEVHIFDFKDTIYNQSLHITPLFFIREEIKFNSIHALQQQMKKDEEIAKNYLKNVREQQD